jgi:hypothetical protein
MQRKDMIDMTRSPNTDRRGLSFSYDVRVAVWNKGQVVPGADPAFFRKDVCGALISWGAYGDTTPSGNGWEIDHILAVANGGTDDLTNLQPLQWQNNRGKGDQMRWTCAVTAAQ